MTILDPCMSLERIKKHLDVLGVVDMRQLLLRIKIDYKMAIYIGNCYHYQRQTFFRKMQLQIEKSGFMKTCDEHIHSRLVA